MAAVIIKKKDLERLGRTLLKEVYDFLHNDYILENFTEMKEEQQKLLIKLALYKFKNVNKTVKQQGKSLKITYEEFDKSKYEEEIKIVKEEIVNKSLDIKLIFNVLNGIDLDDEIDGDLLFKKEAFLNLYRVFSGEYSYLED